MTTINDNIARIQELLPAVPEGLTDEQIRTGLANKLADSLPLIEEIIGLLYNDILPKEDAAAMFFVGFISLASIAGNSTEEVAEYAAELLTRSLQELKVGE